MKQSHVKPSFVVDIPEVLEDGVLYVSKEHQIALHKCCCGCGEEVVTPLSPVEWKLIEGSKGVSLLPSIGNWNYRCKSHYFIRENKVLWAGSMSAVQIERVRLRDMRDKKMHIEQQNSNRLRGKVFRFLLSSWKWLRKLFGN